MRRAGGGAEHPDGLRLRGAVGAGARHGGARGRDDQRAPPRRAGGGRVEGARDPARPQPARGGGRVQRVELQQVLAVVADGVRPRRLPRRRPAGAAPHGAALRHAGGERDGEPRHAVQLRRDGGGAVRLHAPPAHGPHRRHRLLQRRRPGVPQRGLLVVAPPPVARQLHEALLGGGLRRAALRRQARRARSRARRGPRRPLRRDEAVVLLPRLRLQLELAAAQAVRQRRGARAVVARARRHAGGTPGVLPARRAQEGAAPEGHRRGAGGQRHRRALEGPHRRPSPEHQRHRRRRRRGGGGVRREGDQEQAGGREQGDHVVRQAHRQLLTWVHPEPLDFEIGR